MLAAASMARTQGAKDVVPRTRTPKAKVDYAAELAPGMLVGNVVLVLWSLHVVHKLARTVMDIMCKTRWEVWEARGSPAAKRLPRTFESLERMVHKPEWVRRAYTEVDFCPNVHGMGKEYKGGQCGRPFWQIPRSKDPNELCPVCKKGRRYRRQVKGEKNRALQPSCTSSYLEPAALATLIFNDPTIMQSRWDEQGRIVSELTDNNPDVRSCFSSVSWRCQVGQGAGLEQVGKNFFCVKLSMADDAKALFDHNTIQSAVSAECQVFKLRDCSFALGTKTSTKWLAGVQTRGKTQDKQWQLLWYASKFRPDKYVEVDSEFFGKIKVCFYIGNSQDDGPAGQKVHGYGQWNRSGGSDPFVENPGTAVQGKKRKTVQYVGTYAKWKDMHFKSSCEYEAELDAVDVAVDPAAAKTQTKRIFGGSVFRKGAPEYGIQPYPFHVPLAFINHGMYHKYNNELKPSFKYALQLPGVESAVDHALAHLCVSTSSRFGALVV